MQSTTKKPRRDPTPVRNFITFTKSILIIGPDENSLKLDDARWLEERKEKKLLFEDFCLPEDEYEFCIKDLLLNKPFQFVKCRKPRKFGHAHSVYKLQKLAKGIFPSLQQIMDFYYQEDYIVLQCTKEVPDLETYYRNLKKGMHLF